MNKYTVKIEGMACQHCAASVTEALGKYGNVTVDLDAKAAYITTDAELDEALVKETIDGIGFDFISMSK